jgi:hypothetical protein
MIAPVRRGRVGVEKRGRHPGIILLTNEKGTPPIWVYWRHCRDSAGGRMSSNRQRASRARAPASGGACGQVHRCNAGRRWGVGAPWRVGGDLIRSPSSGWPRLRRVSWFGSRIL